MIQQTQFIILALTKSNCKADSHIRMEIKDDYDPTQIDNIIYSDDIDTNPTPTSNPYTIPNIQDMTGADSHFDKTVQDELRELQLQSDHSDNDSDTVNYNKD